ncbi:MAG: hypothetical protein EPO64_05595 [Nitrospirae bacterium]|nr:MAG: hypothetical protein EPO64_05595 [Nitrospirota bacterium]
MKPLVSVLLLVIVLQGCSSARGIWPVGQSRVLYPTTTIIPIGEARGEASDYFFTYGGVVDLMHPDIAEVAVQDAIKSKGGDLLIDYTLSLKATRIPFGLFIVGLDGWWITWTAEGTAAKMEYAKPEQPVPGSKKAP